MKLMYVLTICLPNRTSSDNEAKKKPPRTAGRLRLPIRPGKAGTNGRESDYLAFISATVVSSMRLLKPHSLSYHDETFTRRPDTLVSVASKFDEAGL